MERFEAFSLLNADKHALPLVVSMPHSGTLLPENVRAAMRTDAILPSTDWYLPELFAFLKEMGVTMLINHVSRYAADVNRKPGGGHARDARACAVYAQNTFGRLLYDVPPDAAEIAERIRLYHAPYHDALRGVLADKVERHSSILLLDLHSFGRNLREDIVLGNGHGVTASAGTTQIVRAALEQAGFLVAENEPYSGGYITRRYGSRSGPVESLQMELSYAAYIGKRAAGEIETPPIDQALFERARIGMRAAFAQMIGNLI